MGKFRRYELIVEYAERRTFLCPPLSLFEHFGMFYQYLLSRCFYSVREPSFESGLKAKNKLDVKKQMLLQAFESGCCNLLLREKGKEQEDAKIDQNLDLEEIE